MHRLPPLPLVVIALAFGLAGCGSGSSTATAPSVVTAPTGGPGQATGAAGPRGATEAPSRTGSKSKGRASGDDGVTSPDHPEQLHEPTDYTPPVHHDSGGGVKQFESKGGEDSIQQSGSEASSADFAAAAAALHAYLDARAAGAWALACESLSTGIYEQLTELAGRGGGGPSCSEVLVDLSAGLPPRALREVAVADVGAFRVDGDSGFILFHGAHGVDWFVPMVREGGRWKVAAIAPSALP